MNPTRRDFLRTSSALAGALAMPAWPARAGEPVGLQPRVARVPLAGSGYPPTEVWGYGGTVPGPVLRARQGDRLRVVVDNRLPVETTVHWHGIRLPNAMDGVPHVTQPPIAAGGGRFTYEFALPDAGTFWYHPHLAQLRAARARAVRGAGGRGARAARGGPRRGVGAVGLSARPRGAHRRGFRQFHGREPRRAHRQYRRGERRSARDVRRCTRASGFGCAW